jgi:hypothetical protein
MGLSWQQGPLSSRTIGQFASCSLDAGLELFIVMSQSGSPFKGGTDESSTNSTIRSTERDHGR